MCYSFLTINALAGNDDMHLFTMFPVPLNTSKLTIKPTQTLTSISTFELRNLVGKKLQEKALPKGAEEVSFTDMNEYPNGLYVIIAKDANGKILETSKLIIQR